jgi:hypothetical protein
MTARCIVGAFIFFFFMARYFGVTHYFHACLPLVTFTSCLIRNQRQLPHAYFFYFRTKKKWVENLYVHIFFISEFLFFENIIIYFYKFDV